MQEQPSNKVRGKRWSKLKNQTNFAKSATGKDVVADILESSNSKELANILVGKEPEVAGFQHEVEGSKEDTNLDMTKQQQNMESIVADLWFDLPNTNSLSASIMDDHAEVFRVHVSHDQRHYFSDLDALDNVEPIKDKSLDT
ncbi:hypothetical protein ACH5RR_003264 [Cinchona calisaya]|uniref:Uncharacterized protein n=1 Tax=Cinchona calisaya TaxID=153742 RepID=A0ABD3AUC2_9GENT